MTISLTGKVALNANINTEFELGNAMSFYRGVAYYKPSTTTIGAFDTTNLNFSEFRGTQNKVTVELSITADTKNYTLNPAAVSGYVAGFTKVYLTINSGVYVGSSSTGSYALTITGFASGDSVYLINNGTIIGRGGNGGDSHSNAAGDPGNAGGNALLLQCPVSITNNGIISGGGGGGGAADGGQTYGGCPPFGSSQSYTGQGGGGGAGYDVGNGGSGDPNGSNGTRTAGGGGAASGGGQGQAGGTSSNGRSGGAAGKYINGSAYATWVVTGTRLGGSA